MDVQCCTLEKQCVEKHTSERNLHLLKVPSVFSCENIGVNMTTELPPVLMKPGV